MQVKLSFIGLGKKDAETIQASFEKVEAALVKATGTMRVKLQERAPDFVGKASDQKDMKDYLDGFGKVLGDTKKSEAKAVFQAFIADSKAVVSFAGTYNEWVTHCRKIRDAAAGPKDGDGKPKNKKPPRIPTDKQMEDIESKIPAMTANQAETIVNKATLTLVATNKAWEHALLMQIQGIAARLEESEQPIYKRIAALILLEAGKVVEQEKASQAIQEAKEVKPPVPLANAA